MDKAAELFIQALNVLRGQQHQPQPQQQAAPTQDPSSPAPGLEALLRAASANSNLELTTNNNANVSTTNTARASATAAANAGGTTKDMDNAATESWYSNLPPEHCAIVDQGVDAMLQKGCRDAVERILATTAGGTTDHGAPTAHIQLPSPYPPVLSESVVDSLTAQLDAFCQQEPKRKKRRYTPRKSKALTQSNLSTQEQPAGPKTKATKKQTMSPPASAIADDDSEPLENNLQDFIDTVHYYTAFQNVTPD